ncbi:MAG TPA: glucose-6-phosphate dehydrogenase assembly protein OpcA [Bryobacteraceae bacterium]|nr:glucose-6-phosphate dehydrogenase assembly protein OpcA [Bryobacteraceae bacterium]
MEKTLSATIHPENILRELSDLWVSLGKEADPDQPSGVLRACTMTLMAVAEETEDPGDVWSVMAALMPEHPSRAIVIRFRQSAARELSARVFSQCWMPFGYRRQICCEQIEISASDASLCDLPAVIVPLAVSDLPVILWCRGARLFDLPEFAPVAQIAHKVVVDSAAFGDPAAILKRLAGSEQVLGDLAWTRLTRWRELVSQIFENRSHCSRLKGVTEVRVGFGGKRPPASGYYMAAWLLDGLERTGAKPEVIWQSATDASPGLTQVELTGSNGHSLHVSIVMTTDAERQTAQVHVDSQSSLAVFPLHNDYLLLREELSIPGRDPVYERSLARAARLASGRKP